MNDRMEREIDELLARLGVGETRRPPATPRRRPLGRAIRGRVPGSPVRLMILSLALLVAAGLLFPALGRPVMALGAGLLVLGYLTWLFEHGPDPTRGSAGWFARFYRWLYDQEGPAA
ncbi:MAG TPA: hypothetical protein VHL09_15790 [Dehalococcoidia bacterium]|nr:hypothetical protein [Dehalococcoidia bacterium]